MTFEIITEQMFTSPTDRGPTLRSTSTGGELKDAIINTEMANQQREYINRTFRIPWEKMLLDKLVPDGVELGVSGSAAYAQEDQVVNDVDLIITFSKRFEGNPDRIRETLKLIRSDIQQLRLTDDEIRFISENLSSQNENDGDLLYIDIPSSDPHLPLPHTLRCVRSDLLAKAVEPLTAMTTTCGKIFPLRKFSDNTPRTTMAILTDGTVIHPKWTREIKEDYMVIRFPGNTWIKEDGEVINSIPRMVHFAASLSSLSNIRSGDLTMIRETAWITFERIAIDYGNILKSEELELYLRNTLIGGHNFSDELVKNAMARLKM